MKNFAYKSKTKSTLLKRTAEERLKVEEKKMEIQEKKKEKSMAFTKK